MIKGTTKVTGVFGWPVAHSRSPAFQNAAFAALGLDFVYVPFAVRPEELPAGLASVRALGMAGVNLTIPHKEAAVSLLDEVSDEARLLGVVNTVRNVEGRLLGSTTDGPGFVRSLREDGGFEPSDRRFLVLGAGGSARAICGALAGVGAAEIIIWNRTASRGTAVAEHLRVKLGYRQVRTVDRAALDDPGLWREVDALVNTTSLGMREGDPCPVNTAGLHQGIFVYDIVYNRETDLIAAARRAGCRSLDGLSMLVFQGALSFEAWTGVPAPVEVMKRALSEEGGER